MLKILQPPRPRKKVIFACERGEQHDIPIYALALRASHVGCLPIILGANTPPEALATAISCIAPQGVILSTTTSMLVRNAPKGMGSYAAPHKQGSDTTSADPISLLGLTARELNEDELLAELNAYQEVCAQTPWLIGGQSLQTWPVLPDELQINISSSYDTFDALVG